MKTGKYVLMAAGLWLLALTCRPAEAEVRVGINIDLPVVSFNGPPELVAIPGSYGYYAADMAEDIFFYQGYWYRAWDNRWHRASSYYGPWAYIGPRYVPQPFLRLPPDYRHRENHGRMGHNGEHRHWQRADRERYREKSHDGGRGERREVRHDGRGGRREHRF